MKVLRRMATASGEQQQKEAAASGGENAQENGDGTAVGSSKEDDG